MRLFLLSLLMSLVTFSNLAQGLLPVTVQQFLDEQNYSERYKASLDADGINSQFASPKLVDGTMVVDAFIAISNEMTIPRLQAAGVTTKLQVKFRRPVSTRDPQITLRGRITGNVLNHYTVHVTLHDSKGRLCDEGDVTYCMFDKARSQEMGFTSCLTEDEAKTE